MATRGEVGGGSGVRASRRRGRGEDAIRGGERARAVRGEGRAARRRSGRRRGIRGPVGGPVARGARGSVGGVPIAVQQEHLRAQKVRLGQERVVAARANERVEGGQRRAHATETELGDGAVVPVVTRRGFGGDVAADAVAENRTSAASTRRSGTRHRRDRVDDISTRGREPRHDTRFPSVYATSAIATRAPPSAARGRRAKGVRDTGARRRPTPRDFQRATLVSSTSERARLGRAHESNLRSSTRRV